MVAEQRDEAAASAEAAEASATTANRFPQQPSQQQHRQQMRRRLVLLLNKLTPTTFELHVSRFLSFVNTTTTLEHEQLIHETVETIVRRASEDGPRYVNMYAQLCRRLSLEWTIAPTQRSFHSVLVDTCRQELIRDGGFATNNEVEEEHSSLLVLSYIDDFDNGRNTEEEEYVQRIAKKLYIEHLRFCGELYILGVLSIDEITGFMEFMSRMAGLSNHSTDPTNSIQNIRLEGFCLLLETIGWKLELPPLSSNLERMECWANLAELIQVGNTQDDQELFRRFLSTRLRFMVVDLLELRSKGWRRVGPLQQRKRLVAKALSQIRVEAEADLGQTSGKKKKKKVHFGGGKK